MGMDIRIIWQKEGSVKNPKQWFSTSLRKGCLQWHIYKYLWLTIPWQWQQCYHTIQGDKITISSQTRPAGLAAGGETGGARTDRSRLPRHGQGIRSDQTSRPRRWVTRAQNPPYSEHYESHARVTKIRTGRDQYKDLWPPSKEGGSAAARGRAGLLFQRHLSHLLPSPAHQSAGHLAASCLLMAMQGGWQLWQPPDTLC